MRKWMVFFSALCLLAFTVSATHALVEPGWTTSNIPHNAGDIFVTFEDGTRDGIINTQYPGLLFTADEGWKYLQKPYFNYPLYWCIGDYVGYTTSTVGRIDFTKGTATYASVLVACNDKVVLEAYAADGTSLGDSGWAPVNTGTNTMTRLTVEAPGIAYVVIHDSGGHWIIDDFCTDAPATDGNVPEFPSPLIPAGMIIGIIALILIAGRREH